MEKVAWTDERLDDMSQRMDAGFDRMDRDIRDLRSEVRSDIGGLRKEMHSQTTGLRKEMHSQGTHLRSEMQAGFGELRGEIAQLRTVMYRFGGAIIAALVASAILHGI